MGFNSGIQWTDHTITPWIGCTKVSPGCDDCYAESYANRYGNAVWGPGRPRQLTSDSNWRLPLKWNAQAEKIGVRYRVFCASLADVFDNEVDTLWRARLFDLIGATPHLDWLLLTKRIGNVNRMLASWVRLDQIWPNVWLGISVVNQEEADRDIPKLLATKAAIRFLSLEPLLGPVTLFDASEGVLRGPAVIVSGGLAPSTPDGPAEGYDDSYPGIDWVIVGGESGPNARPMHPDWARSLRNQCQAAGVAFFFKQWGEYRPCELEPPGRAPLSVITLDGGHLVGNPLGRSDDRNAEIIGRFGKKRAGRLLDGREWNELPAISEAA